MNPLDPELQRLIRWSRAATDEPIGELPFGAAARIANRCREAAEESEPAWWPRLQVATACMSVAILVAGTAIWFGQMQRSPEAYDFVPAYQLIAQNITP